MAAYLRANFRTEDSHGSPALRRAFRPCLLPMSIGPVQAAASRIVIGGASMASRHEQDRHPRMGWGQLLPGFLAEDVIVLNLAGSGRSTRSCADQGHLAALRAALRPGDLLLIQFGHHDARQDDPSRFADRATDFPAGLRRFIESAQRAGANAGCGEREVARVRRRRAARRRAETGRPPW